MQLIRIGLEHPDIRHEIFYGASDNERGWWDNSAAFRLGYRPQGRAEDHSARRWPPTRSFRPIRSATGIRAGLFAATNSTAASTAPRCERDYKLRPSNGVTLSVATSTSSRQRTFTAIISPLFGDVPRENAATPHCAQNR